MKSSMICVKPKSSSTAEVCWRHGVSSASFYKLKSKFGGQDMSDIHRLKVLEARSLLSDFAFKLRPATGA